MTRAGIVIEYGDGSKERNEGERKKEEREWKMI
jgi:hypothetical protein